ncbi:hypothetical protein OSTOST_00271 [Ostertagia ostertagi]
MTDLRSKRVGTDPPPQNDVLETANTNDVQGKAHSNMAEKCSDQLKKTEKGQDQVNRSSETSRDRGTVSQPAGSPEQNQSQRNGKMKFAEQKLGKSAQQDLSKSGDGDTSARQGLSDCAKQSQRSAELSPEAGKTAAKIPPVKDTHSRSSPNGHLKGTVARQEGVSSPLTTPNPPMKRRSPESTRSASPRGNTVALNVEEHQKRPRHRSRGAPIDDTRRNSTMSESSRMSLASHKSVTFSDRVQLHEIERNEMSSSEEDAALMSDDELSKRPLDRLRRSTYFRQDEPGGEQMDDLFSPQEDDHMMFETVQRTMMLPDDGTEESDVDANGYPLFQQTYGQTSARRESDSSRLSVIGESGSSVPMNHHDRFAQMRSTGVQATEMFDGSYPPYYPSMERGADMEVFPMPRSASGYFEEEDSDEEEPHQPYPHVMYSGEDSYSPGNSPVFFPGRTPRAENLMGMSAYANPPSSIPRDDEEQLTQGPPEQLQSGRIDIAHGQHGIDIAQGQHGTLRSEWLGNTSSIPNHIMQPRASLPVQVTGNGVRNERGDIEEEMRRQFLARFGAGRRAPVAEEDPCDPVHSMGSSDSIALSGSRESVVSAASIAKEAATHRNFNY